jgi:hypothetical protein
MTRTFFPWRASATLRQKLASLFAMNLDHQSTWAASVFFLF